MNQEDLMDPKLLAADGEMAETADALGDAHAAPAPPVFVPAEVDHPTTPPSSPLFAPREVQQ